VSSSISKKNGRRVLKSVAKEVAGYRPDLKVGGWGSLWCNTVVCVCRTQCTVQQQERFRNMVEIDSRQCTHSCIGA
jgi:hypothetical protein